MLRGWIWEEKKAEGALVGWGNKTVSEIEGHKKEAAEKIEMALQELYLATGIFFEVSSKHYRQDELNAKTQWVTREYIQVTVTGKI